MIEHISPPLRKLILILLFFGALGALAVIGEYRRKRRVDSYMAGLGFRRMSRREFRNFLGRHKFASLQPSLFFTPATSDFYVMDHEGTSTCAFTIAIGGKNTTTRSLAVAIKAESLKFPHFILKPKTFGGEVGDMLGLRKHDDALPPVLTNIYDVTSDDASALAAVSGAEFVDLMVADEGMEVEAKDAMILVHTILRVAPENYEVAIRQARTLAEILLKAQERD